MPEKCEKTKANLGLLAEVKEIFMFDGNSMLLAFKLFLVPTFIALIAVSGRRWGASVAGLLSGLPVIAGPITWFI